MRKRGLLIVVSILVGSLAIRAEAITAWSPKIEVSIGAVLRRQARIAVVRIADVREARIEMQGSAGDEGNGIAVGSCGAVVEVEVVDALKGGHDSFSFVLESSAPFSPANSEYLAFIGPSPNWHNGKRFPGDERLDAAYKECVAQSGYSISDDGDGGLPASLARYVAFLGVVSDGQVSVRRETIVGKLAVEKQCATFLVRGARDLGDYEWVSWRDLRALLTDALDEAYPRNVSH